MGAVDTNILPLTIPSPVDCCRHSRKVRCHGPFPGHADIMEKAARESGVTGNLLHDAHIAALCIEHGISELLTGDRDFSRFPLAVVNPFAA